VAEQEAKGSEERSRDAGGKFVKGNRAGRAGRRGRSGQGGKRVPVLERLRRRLESEDVSALPIAKAMRLAQILMRLEGMGQRQGGGKGAEASEEPDEQDQGVQAALRVIGERRAAKKETDED